MLISLSIAFQIFSNKQACDILHFLFFTALNVANNMLATNKVAMYIESSNSTQYTYMNIS